MDFFTSSLLMGVISIVILVFSAIIHEVSHGFVADRLGDPTARLMGRLTLNPKKHIDPFMSILLPLLLILSNSPIIFGGAKPVPVDEFNLKEGRRDIALVALSGPLSNILMAVGGTLLYRLLFFFPNSQSIIFVFLLFILMKFIQINVLLAIFNLLPLPPLDGSKIFSLLLPETAARAYLSIGAFGSLLVFLLIFTSPMQQIITNLYQLGMSLLGF